MSTKVKATKGIATTVPIALHTASIISGGLTRREMLEKERDRIIKAAQEYEKTGDPRLIKDINKMNLHFHAKIEILAHTHKDEAEEMRKLLDETNGAIEQAAAKHHKIVKYVDISNTPVKYNGTTRPLHEHLNEHMHDVDNNNQRGNVKRVAQIFVDELNTPDNLAAARREAMETINLDAEFLAHGKEAEDIYGLMALLRGEEGSVGSSGGPGGPGGGGTQTHEPQKEVVKGKVEESDAEEWEAEATEVKRELPEGKKKKEGAEEEKQKKDAEEERKKEEDAEEKKEDAEEKKKEEEKKKAIEEEKQKKDAEEERKKKDAEEEKKKAIEEEKKEEEEKEEEGLSL